MSEKFLMELYERVKSLEERVNALEGNKDSVKNNIRGSNKYREITKYLLSGGEDIVKLDFSEIEKLLSFSLPDSAYAHRAFWANTESHSIALSWLSAGYYTTEVNMTNKTVQFERRL